MKKILLILTLLCVSFNLFSCQNIQNTDDKNTINAQNEINNLKESLKTLQSEKESLQDEVKLLNENYFNLKDEVDTLSSVSFGYFNSVIAGLQEEVSQNVVRRLENVTHAYFISADFHKGIEEYIKDNRVTIITEGATNYDIVQQTLDSQEFSETDLIIVPFESESEDEYYSYLSLFHNILEKTNLLIYYDFAPKLSTTSVIERNIDQLDDLGYRFSDKRIIYDDTEDVPEYKKVMADTIKSYLTQYTKIKIN
ncbi:MAG: hypothetical protein Q4F88_03680 [Eubacteriales bacterium]|nr:hypothetical protein [Eubacteriales bacterium]